MTTGEWDNTLARETIGIPVGIDSIWPPELAEARVVVENTTVRMPWAAGMENTAALNAKNIENFQRLMAGGMNAQQFAEAMRR